MRLLEKTLITLSEDALSEPKQIRLSEDSESIELSLAKECLVRTEVFPVGSHVINLGNITSPKWLFIKPSADISVSLNGNPNLIFRGGKISKLWVTLTTVQISVLTASVTVTIALAGE